MTRSDAFLARLRSGQVLLSDGACGTAFQSSGLDLGKIPEAWLLERPQQIRDLHQSYVRAGSDIVLTCSFGGTGYRLQGHGLADRVVEINRLAAELAREAVGEDILVAGDMGPTGELLAPIGSITAEQVAAAFEEQAKGLTDGGADLLLIETMSDIGEAVAAIEGARRASELPIFCTFSFDTHGRTMMGTRPEQVAREIGPLVEGLGANCGREPAEFDGILRAMRAAAPEAILWAKPNAGLPRVVGDQAIYDASPCDMGRFATQLVEAGAQIIGGCCGTTPDHLASMAEGVRSAVARQRKIA